MLPGNVLLLQVDVMKIRKQALWAVALSLLIAPAAVLAEKGGKNGKGHEKERVERYDDRRDDKGRDSRHERDDVRVEFRFGDDHRRVVSDYYGPQVRGGKCPPGLAKKGNGCMPPGQAKKWAMGRPLPRDVVFYELPHDLIVRMPPPPVGHRYVRVAGDVLLIAVGTSMVVDALQDILR